MLDCAALRSIILCYKKSSRQQTTCVHSHLFIKNVLGRGLPMENLAMLIRDQENQCHKFKFPRSTFEVQSSKFQVPSLKFSAVLTHTY